MAQYSARMAISNAVSVQKHLREGQVIPAHPLALDASRKLDERRQRGLTRYYIDAGAGGIAVGVHTTQFAIRDPAIGLYRTVLELAAEEASAAIGTGSRPFAMIAGVCGHTPQALSEANIAISLGYDAALLSLGDWLFELFVFGLAPGSRSRSAVWACHKPPRNHFFSSPGLSIQ